MMRDDADRTRLSSINFLRTGVMDGGGRKGKKRGGKRKGRRRDGKRGGKVKD